MLQSKVAALDILGEIVVRDRKIKAALQQIIRVNTGSIEEEEKKKKSHPFKTLVNSLFKKGGKSMFEYNEDYLDNDPRPARRMYTIQHPYQLAGRKKDQETINLQKVSKLCHLLDWIKMVPKNGACHHAWTNRQFVQSGWTEEKKYSYIEGHASIF